MSTRVRVGTLAVQSEQLGAMRAIEKALALRTEEKATVQRQARCTCFVCVCVRAYLCACVRDTLLACVRACVRDTVRETVRAFV